MRDNIDARSCLRSENARWHRGSLPSDLADCLRISIPSANTHGSPVASQRALQVSQCLRRCVLAGQHQAQHYQQQILNEEVFYLCTIACICISCLNQCKGGARKLQYIQTFKLAFAVYFFKLLVAFHQLLFSSQCTTIVDFSQCFS